MKKMIIGIVGSVFLLGLSSLTFAASDNCYITVNMTQQWGGYVFTGYIVSKESGNKIPLQVIKQGDKLQFSCIYDQQYKVVGNAVKIAQVATSAKQKHYHTTYYTMTKENNVLGLVWPTSFTNYKP